MKTMLVTGADGAVGSYVSEVFGSKYNLILTDAHSLDVTRSCNLIRDLDPWIVLHLAAATDVDECERNPDWAYLTNSIGTQNVAMATKRKMVYVSTAGVFQGDKYDPYNEFDEAVPANVYGWSKLRGEQLLAHTKAPEDVLVVRSGWMFGGGGGLDKKFVGKIEGQLDAGAFTIEAVDDKIGSPTYAKDLLHTIDRLLDADAHGTFHGCNEGVCSRYDVACEIVRLRGAGARVRAVDSTRFPLPAPRARSEAMDTLMLRLAGVEASRPWQDALAEYLAA
jgi:dTDP-4-dehydrorhamnose reductase